MYYTVNQLRDIERQAASHGMALMPLAGAAAADFVRTRFGPAARVLCLAGPGNNGGDALVCARLLRQAGMAVTLLLPSGAQALPSDAASAHADWLASGGDCLSTLTQGRWHVVVDGLFGIGLNRPLGADWQTLIDQINTLGLPVLAIDVPSGLHADTGAALGRPIRARWTLSMIAPARGLLTGAGPDHAGETQVATLHLDAAILPPPSVVTDTHIALPSRARDSHKGRYGTVQIIGGAAGMAGAALLAGRAAAHGGAGKVRVGMLDERVTLDPLQPELMLAPAMSTDLSQADVVAIGPGLGDSADAQGLLTASLAAPCPLVVDADALNLLASHQALSAQLSQRHATSILTPHPAEAARLLARSTADVQADRYGAARTLAQRFKATVVLKGQGSVIDTGTQTAVNRSGSGAMANAGQGDVLTGLIAALLAQGLDAWSAARLACHVHGAASDALQARRGQWVTLASEVAVEAGVLLGRHRAD